MNNNPAYDGQLVPAGSSFAADLTPRDKWHEKLRRDVARQLQQVQAGIVLDAALIERQRAAARNDMQEIVSLHMEALDYLRVAPEAEADLRAYVQREVWRIQQRQMRRG